MGDTYTMRNGKQGKYTPEQGAKGRATIAQNQAEIRAYKAEKKARKIKAKKIVKLRKQRMTGKAKVDTSLPF